MLQQSPKDLRARRLEWRRPIRALVWLKGAIPPFGPPPAAATAAVRPFTLSPGMRRYLREAEAKATPRVARVRGYVDTTRSGCQLQEADCGGVELDEK
jgi:hypothetical protein